MHQYKKAEESLKYFVTLFKNLIYVAKKTAKKSILWARSGEGPVNIIAMILSTVRKYVKLHTLLFPTSVLIFIAYQAVIKHNS